MSDEPRLFTVYSRLVHQLSRCPACRAREVDGRTPYTVYACASSIYDGIPATFLSSHVHSPWQRLRAVFLLNALATLSLLLFARVFVTTREQWDHADAGYTTVFAVFYRNVGRCRRLITLVRDGEGAFHVYR